MSFQSLAASGSKKQLEHEVLVWCLKEVIYDTDPDSWKCHEAVSVSWPRSHRLQLVAMKRRVVLKKVAYADAEMTSEGC